MILQTADGRFSRISLSVAEPIDLGPDVTFEDLISVREELGLD
ncbi:hypothetical protein OAL10_00290 [Gammaproteobacteria bacterium]|nr:hypothetical protein [Gammaproteobacteria bacterium]